MANLFDKAKKSAPKTKAAKDEKVRIKIKDPSFYDKIENLENIQDMIKSYKAKSDMISDELKTIGKLEWSRLYEDKGRNPGSIMLEQIKDGNTAQMMFVPSDKYITINDERAEELRDIYGDEIVTETTNFSFDNDMIEKYGEILSRLIEESTEIDDDDKEKIIKANKVFSVTKGVIDYLPKFGTVEQVMEDVNPVISLKNIQVLKG